MKLTQDTPKMGIDLQGTNEIEAIVLACSELAWRGRRRGSRSATVSQICKRAADLNVDVTVARDQKVLHLDHDDAVAALDAVRWWVGRHRRNLNNDLAPIAVIHASQHLAGISIPVE